MNKLHFSMTKTQLRLTRTDETENVFHLENSQTDRSTPMYTAALVHIHLKTKKEKYIIYSC